MLPRGFDFQPVTPGVFAMSTWMQWNSWAGPVIVSAAKEGKDIDASRIGSVEADGIFLTDDIIEAAIVGTHDLGLSSAPRQALAGEPKEPAVKQALIRIDASLRTMLDAMVKGTDPGTRSPKGIRCLDFISAGRFWDATKVLALEYGFLSAKTSIPLSAKLEAAAKGAEEGFASVGVAAGRVLTGAGQALGAGVGGFFEGIGIVQGAVLLGGAYVATRVI